ncbi:MAG TPA: carboxylesterase/lipase family protein [Dehalococcoidia bacterium]|nr:carboxylesterase/lipase family protein [Dehalococcoidia bacterium]
MKRIVLFGITLLLMVPLFTSCNAISQEDIDAILAEADAADAQAETLQGQIDTVQSLLDAVQSDLDDAQSDLDDVNAELAEIEESLYIVNTNAGKVRGTTEKDVLAFKGIHYGESTEGSARFLPPQSVEPWEGVFDATEYGQTAPQYGSLATPDVNQGEDCLVLNVWTPAVGDGGERPVMVWLHGGGYASGSGSEATYNGANLADRGDVVVVTINHRLNVFGYLYLDEIGGEEFTGSGMAGMLDIVLALEWVRDNIEAFGGDPDNVTIFGESGGGAKVSTLLAMPSAEGLFHKAIVQSGPGLTGVDPDDATAYAESLLEELGLGADELDQLQQVPIQEMLDAIGAITGSLSPVVDGYYLPANPFTPVAAPTAANVPLMIGTNHDEITFMMMMAGTPADPDMTEEELRERLAETHGDNTDDIIAAYQNADPEATPWQLYIWILSDEYFRRYSVILAERKMEGGTAPVYMYLFTKQSERYPDFGTPHFMEVAYVFDNTADSPNDALATIMSKAWIAFARSGDPNHAGMPTWEPYTLDDRATMFFDIPCQLVLNPYGDVLEVWE